MIVSCDGCNTRYMLADEKVPEIGIRVRCPKCRYVWRLTPQTPEPVFEVSSSEFASDTPIAETPKGGWASMEQPRTSFAPDAAAPEIQEEIEITDEKPEAEAKPEAHENPKMRKKKERAKRLARVFVSDILVYNREKRDQGLANGDLMSVLGSEIKKAWEAYKEKVGPEVVESSEYFREALNDILAEGQKIF